MRATYMYGAGDVRVIDVPDPIIKEPTDAIVRVVRACVCGSDLHPPPLPLHDRHPARCLDGA
jgi:threonine dehydrogenase-like Zn-dependent dehydrogenase